MTRPKIDRYPVSSFGPELMSVLLKGSRERVEIPCPDQRTMQSIQMRLQMLRGAMFREKHPQYTLVTKARTSRTWNPIDKNVDCVLVVQPNDAQFTDILTAAGIRATKNDRDILEDISDEPAAQAPLAPPEVNPYDKWKKLV